MTTIYVAVVHHKHGEEVYAGGTPQSRDVQVRGYCSYYWADVFDDDSEPPEDNLECIRRYFNESAAFGAEWCDYKEIELT